ncbi:hypothetical protein ACQUWM_04880 [Marinobacter sp. DUT-3]|uniref:hypothetical protein n=1 Tax=Marinobacter sp. DUT-3 TaxID=3412036 RepID=UPI003D17C184
MLDRNKERMRKGFECPACGYKSSGGRMHFHINIHILIDLIQESYHSPPGGAGYDQLYEGDGPHDISVVIFFCTLREALLENLISRLMSNQHLPDGVQERLLADNKSHIQKQDKLFRALTGDKWKEAVQKASAAVVLDYVAIDEFVQHAANIRNEFIHSGRKWAINRELSKACVDHVWGLINVYVSLHNLYLHKCKNL